MDIQDWNQIVVLEDKADIAAAEDGKLLIVHLRQLLIPHHHAAGGGGIQTAHHVKQGGLTGAGSADHRHKFALLHREVHAIQGAGNVRLCAVVFFKISCLQNFHNSYLPFLIC